MSARQTTTVRFRMDAASHMIAGRQHGSVASLRGKEVEICLPPEAPDPGWTCGTEYVWRIPDDEIERLTGSTPPGRIFACEHQLELD